MTTFYISGPLAANPVAPSRNENKIRMNNITEILRKQWPKDTYVNPLEVDPYNCNNPDCGDADGHQWQCWMRGDIRAMMDCDAIVMLPGWEFSSGAQLELSIARHLKWQVYVYYHSNLLPAK